MYLANCPVCGEKFDLHASSVAPFCSVRCRRIDLGRWLGEDYGIPVDPDEDDPDEASELPDESDADE